MFANLTVIELASVLAGPSVGMFFAELGAEVIKVENPVTMGDVTRGWKLESEPQNTDISGYFSAVNWGKKSIAVNAAVADGREVIYSLIRAADIVLASFKPGDDQKLGLDYETLKLVNSSLIYGHVTGYGTDDPRAGYDAILQAASGFTYMNGSPDSSPTKMPVALIDVLAAHQLKEALLLALYKRVQSGDGAYVHVSLLQSGIASLANQAANWLVGKEIPERLGSDHPNIYPYGTAFRTSDDKELVLGIGNDQQFKKFCHVIKRPELAVIPLYSSNQQRVKNREKLHALLSEQIAKFERDTLVADLESHGIPTGGILNMQEVFEQPAGQDMLVNDPATEENPLSGVKTIAFDASFIDKSTHMSEPPHLNQHAQEILRERLGYSKEELAQLRKLGAILWM